MFMSRLDDAKESVISEAVRPPSKKINFKNDHKDHINGIKSAESNLNISRIKDVSNSNNESRDNRNYSNYDDDDDTDETTILEKCSEYLFDANLTPEYQEIDTIQKKAIKLFYDSLDKKVDYNNGNHCVIEYTFEQENIHNDFKTVLEKIISDFLFDEKILIDDFYTYLQKHFKATQKVNTTIIKNIGK
jgi:hypothetical protein